jgi:hypothetical protein
MNQLFDVTGDHVFHRTHSQHSPDLSQKHGEESSINDGASPQ